MSRIRTTIPSASNPYNMPIKPDLVVTPCGGFATVYKAPWGVYGNNSLREIGPFDFVCPTSKMCLSETSLKSAFTATEMLCGPDPYQMTFSGPRLQSVSIWDPPFAYRR